MKRCSYFHCEIIIRSPHCPICGIRTKTDEDNVVQCAKGWYVCGNCHPIDCISISRPENKEVVVGKVEWVISA